MIESPGEASEESSCNSTIAMVTRTKPQEERCSQLWGREDARNGIQWADRTTMPATKKTFGLATLVNGSG